MYTDKYNITIYDINTIFLCFKCDYLYPTKKFCYCQQINHRDSSDEFHYYKEIISKKLKEIPIFEGIFELWKCYVNYKFSTMKTKIQNVPESIISSDKYIKQFIARIAIHMDNNKHEKNYIIKVSIRNGQYTITSLK